MVIIEPIKAHIGAVVRVDRAKLGDPEFARSCRAALERYGVLVFPKIGVSDAEQLRFTDSLGRRLDFTNKIDGGKIGTAGVYTITLDPEINRQKEYVTGTYFWHMDGLTQPGQPPKATLLSGRTIAAEGGDTHFANLYAAYEMLPHDDKIAIDGLRVAHDMTAYLTSIVEQPSQEELDRWISTNKVNDYPLVWTHQSGRKSLVMGATADHIIGMERAAGRALITRLHQWASHPDFTYYHKWSQGDLVIWDNYGTLHRVTPYAADSGRSMHRTTIEGEEVLQ